MTHFFLSFSHPYSHHILSRSLFPPHSYLNRIIPPSTLWVLSSFCGYETTYFCCTLNHCLLHLFPRFFLSVTSSHSTILFPKVLTHSSLSYYLSVSYILSPFTSSLFYIHIPTTQLYILLQNYLKYLVQVLSRSSHLRPISVYLSLTTGKIPF